MTAALLPRLSGPARPVLPLAGEVALALGRVHEIAGPARRTLAAMLAGRAAGPVLWVQPGWLPERLHPEGLHPLADPGRLIFATLRRPEDLLWTMEEGLRCGQVAVVVADLAGAPALTPVRRLQLAAEAGAAAARTAPPLGLLLTPGEGGAPGVETRWTMAPRHRAGVSEWRLVRVRARGAPPAAWRLSRAEGALRAAPEAVPA